MRMAAGAARAGFGCVAGPGAAGVTGAPALGGAVAAGGQGPAPTRNGPLLRPALCAQSVCEAMATYVPGASSSSAADQPPLASRGTYSFCATVPSGVETSIPTWSSSPSAVPACPVRVGCVPRVASAASAMNGAGATSSNHVSVTDGWGAVAVLTTGVWTIALTWFAPPPPPPPLIARLCQGAPPPPPP